MTVRCAGAECVVLDTSVFVNFAEADTLAALAGFLGDRAVRTTEVQAELDRDGLRRKFPKLRQLDSLRWPGGDPYALNTPLLAELTGIKQVHRRGSEDLLANLGEIATYLAARELGGLGIVDDDLMKPYFVRRRMPRMSSALVAAEMTASGHIDEIDGLRTYELATPFGIGEVEFRLAVARFSS